MWFGQLGCRAQQGPTRVGGTVWRREGRKQGLRGEGRWGGGAAGDPVSVYVMNRTKRRENGGLREGGRGGRGVERERVGM